MNGPLYHDALRAHAGVYPRPSRGGRPVALVGLCLSLAGCASGPWRPVSEGVWIASGAVAESRPANRGHTGNIAFVQAAREGWLIGSGPGPEVGTELREGLRRQLGARATRLVSPRAHPETVLGATVFSDLPHQALPEVAQAMATRCGNCAARLAARLGGPAPPERGEPAPIALPHTPLLAWRGGLGPSRPGPPLGTGPHFFALERAPGEWTTAVLHGRTLLAPGLVWGRQLVPDLSEASLPALEAALRALRTLAPLTVVPEQGAPGGLDLIDKDLRYWGDLRTHTCAALRAGRTLDQAQAAQTPPPELAHGAHAALNQARHAQNTQRAWLALEDALLDREEQACPDVAQSHERSAALSLR